MSINNQNLRLRSSPLFKYWRGLFKLVKRESQPASRLLPYLTDIPVLNRSITRRIFGWIRTRNRINARLLKDYVCCVGLRKSAYMYA
jgi:hypothetical protein